MDIPSNESEHPLKNAKLWGAEGGKARKRNTTKKERSANARLAADARWEKSGRVKVCDATHSGTLKIENIPCAVLEDGRRVLSETGMVEALGLYRSGAVQAREAAASSRPLPLFVANKNIQPFVDDELAEILRSPIWFREPGNAMRQKGVDARVIPRICNVWLRARDAGVLAGNKRQELVAAKADILIRGLAEVGIVALIDEATGYERDKKRNDLAAILEAFVAKEIQRWIRTFEYEFYELICLLRNEPIERAIKRPQYLGNITNDLVYRRLAPGVLQTLQDKNPVMDTGRRKHKMFQLLTPDHGHPRLKEHLASVVTAMKMAKELGLSWEKFLTLLNKTHPRFLPMPLFDSDENNAPANPQLPGGK